MKIRVSTDYEVLRCRVVDSDTLELWCVIDDDIAVRCYVRLRGLEGGEKGTIEGARAELHLGQILQLSNARCIYLRANRRNRDNHGRIVGDIILADGSSLCYTLLSSGFYRARSAYREEAKPTNQ